MSVIKKFYIYFHFPICPKTRVSSKKKRSSSTFFPQFLNFRPKTQVNSKKIIMNLILLKYFTLYIYKELFATPRKKQNNPLRDPHGRDPPIAIPRLKTTGLNSW